MTNRLIPAFFIPAFFLAALYLLAVAAVTRGDAPSDGLFRAVCAVESGDNPKARNASEDAVGAAQIRRIVVDDLNRILKADGRSLRFSYDDRWDREKSRQMFDLYLSYYGRLREQRGKRADDEAYARIWNGGPNGPEKSATVSYWNRVRKEMRR